MDDALTPELAAALERLRREIRRLGSALVAFSGGVDSTLLARVAHETLGEKAVAVTACSETYPQFEFEEAVALAKRIGIRHMVIETSELQIEGFRNNPPDRCYFCKKELFGKLRALADELKLQYVLDGSNTDDTGDYRPGMKAARELDVRSPLKDCGLSKEAIRAISRHLGLPTWNKPAYACLSSRFPYGETITPEAVRKVALAEEFLRGLGLQQLRVRHHGDTARIEVPVAALPRLIEPDTRERVIARFKELDYLYVTLDLQGYRTGSMNEPLARNEAGDES